MFRFKETESDGEVVVVVVVVSMDVPHLITIYPLAFPLQAERENKWYRFDRVYQILRYHPN